MRPLRSRASKLLSMPTAFACVIGLLSQAAPTPAAAVSSEFNILWGINTQIEPLADPTATDKAQIRQLQSLVDGYSLNVLNGGLLSYWPSRPYYCAVHKVSPQTHESYLVIDNTKYDVASLRIQCNQLYHQYVNSLHGQDQRQVYFDAVGRMIRNLNLASQHEAGKIINAQTIVSSRYFSYDPARDTIIVKTVPSLDLLAKNDAIPDSLFIYQEGTLPEQMLQVPTERSGPIGYLPNNTRMVGMISNALRAYQHSVRKLEVNLRKWQPGESPAIVSALNAAASGYVVGINFELGPRGLEQPMRRGGTKAEDVASGFAWLLANTTNPVSLLMPAYWPCSDTCTVMNTEDTRASLIANEDAFVTKLDQDVRADGARTGLCTDRISLIPGGYGTPIHPRVLPIYTPSGKLAGTVGGELVELHNLRSRLCG